jgi:predicted ATP-dependent endonuclease of OLD family
MRISFVEIRNFRKLKSCRVEFSDMQTVFVGANNSGKTVIQLDRHQPNWI